MSSTNLKFFTYSTNRKVKNKFNVTQFGKICEYLGILIETTGNAVSKANIERENGTVKNRLIAELRHENITDIDVANKYLNKVFIPKINKIFYMTGLRRPKTQVSILIVN